MATEKRLIDANELLKDAEDYGPILNEWASFLDVEWLIDAQHTVDAVEVVRCKNCASYEETCPGYGYCYHWDYEQGMSPNQVESDDFCSYGERKTK